MYDVNTILELRDDNLYAGGQVLLREDGTAELAAVLPTYVPGPGDKFLPELKVTDSLDALAYAYYKEVVEDAERNWWVLALVNDIDNPLDLSEHVGRRLLIPDLIRFRLLAAAA